MNASIHAHGTTKSQLRPRTRRLISGLDEGDEVDFNPDTAPAVRIASPIPSPHDSRSASPIPRTRLSRPNSSHGPSEYGNGSLRGRHGFVGGGSGSRKGGADSPNSLAGLWGNSWTTLQGIATDLLGSDLAGGRDHGGSTAKPFARLQMRHGSSSAPPRQWGPSVPIPTSNPSGIALGSREERENALRAQKRKDMLTRQESSYLDTLGKYKRRTSDDFSSFSAPPGDNEARDALVYVHHVQKGDTLAGITIKYNIAAAAVRKANRMWPNDPIQVRTTLILPVDACGVKGKPVGNGEAMDLFSSEIDALSAGQAEEVPTPTPQNPDGASPTRSRADSTTSKGTNRTRTASISSSATTSESQPQWEHDSWVLLAGATKPTQIARLSRRALGYFPPARRKSNCYSDFNVTPSTSFDLARTPSQDLLSHPVLSPLREDEPPTQRPRRGRKHSNAGNGYFPSYLAGPGGVGTMGRNVHSPGPAQDGLNKAMAKYLPDVAPPKNQTGLYQPDLPVQSMDLTPGASGVNTPTIAGSGGVDLANVGGAIEGWMRKVAAGASKALEKPQSRQSSRGNVGASGRGTPGVGDLIEMTNEFEIGDDDEPEPERGRQSSAVRVGPSTTGSSYFDNAPTSRHKTPRDRAKKGKDD